MHRYLLDANVLVDVRKGRPLVVQRFAALRDNEAVQSVITHGELLFGVSKSIRAHSSRDAIMDVARRIPVLPISAEVAEVYGPLRAHLESRGEIIGTNDLWIAAHAVATGLILVTNNEREFRHIPKLNVENWAVSPAAR